MGKSREYMHNVALVSKEKGYTKDEFSNIIIICCSDQMEENGYDSITALQKAEEWIKSGLKAQQVIEKLLKLTGYEVGKY